MNHLKKGVVIVSLVLISTISYGQEDNRKQRPDGPPDTDTVFKDLDTDKDHKISLKEVKGPLKKDLKKIDTNEDGFISKEELEKAPKPEKPRRRNTNS